MSWQNFEDSQKFQSAYRNCSDDACMLRFARPHDACAPAEEKKTRLLWKTTTNTVGDVVEEESWNAVNEGSVRAVEATPGWQIFDIRAISRQSLEQHLNLYSFDAVHFAPQVCTTLGPLPLPFQSHVRQQTQHHRAIVSVWRYYPNIAILSYYRDPASSINARAVILGRDPLFLLAAQCSISTTNGLLVACRCTRSSMTSC